MADTLSQALLEASLLSSLSEEDEGSVVIDVDRRTMVLPTGFFFGVYNDKDILSVPFILPRYYNDLDLSEFQITINYINSAGYGNVYRVTDAEVTEDVIRFKWVTGRGVFVKEGTVRFIVCLRQIGTGGEVEKEFNTTIASANVLKGLEVDENPDPIAYSILAHMEELKDQADAAVEVVEGAADRIDDAVSEAEQAIAAMYHSPYVAPTAADMLSHDKVYVYTGNETGYTFGDWYYWNGSAFVSGGVYNATAFETDVTLTQSGKAADAKKTGDEISELKEDLEQSALTDQIKQALLEMFRHVTFLDQSAEEAYQELESLLAPGIITIGPKALILVRNAKAGDPVALKLFVKTIQDFNGYDYPWTGGNGNNIVPYYQNFTRNGITMAVDGEGVLTLSGTATATVLHGERLTFNKDVVYFVGGSPALSNASFTIRDDNGGIVNDNGIIFGTGDFGGTDGRISSAQNNYVVQHLTRIGSGVSPSGKWYPIIIPEGKNNHLKSKFASGTKGGLTFTIDSDGIVTINGTNTGTVWYGVEVTLPADDYVIAGNRGAVIRLLDGDDGTPLAETGNVNFSGSDTASHRGAAFSLAEEMTIWVAIECTPKTFSNAKIYPVLCDKVVKSTNYVPYTNTCPFSTIAQVKMNHGESQVLFSTDTYNIPQNVDFYGGVIDFVNQTFKAYKHYSSYNGETLAGEWLSSMELYSSGNLPSVGAEVIDLNDYDTLSISVDKIALLDGNNALWSSDGDTMLSYERGVGA